MSEDSDGRALARLEAQLQAMAQTSAEARARHDDGLKTIGERITRHSETLHRKIEDVSQQVQTLDECVDRRIGRVESKLGTAEGVGKFAVVALGVAGTLGGAVAWGLAHLRLLP